VFAAPRSPTEISTPSPFFLSFLQGIRFYPCPRLAPTARPYPSPGRSPGLGPPHIRGLKARHKIPAPAPKLSESNTHMELLRFNDTVEHDPNIDAWMKHHAGELGTIAHHWFEVMRNSGDEVRELLHDGGPVVCLGDVPFAYVNAFTSHVNVGFFQGASLPDPAHLLQGTGKFMRHVKLKPGTPANIAAISTLIAAAYTDIKSRIENG